MASALAEKILDKMRQVCPEEGRFYPLHEPLLGRREEDYVLDCLRNDHVSSVSSYVRRLEAAMAAYTGHAHAVAVSSGTAGLHLALVVAGVQPGDEVLCPSISFVASANAIAHAGALPHFVAVSQTDMGVEAEALEVYLQAKAEQKEGRLVNKATGRRISALMAVHVLGHPCNSPALKALCERYTIALVEDAAEAVGSYRAGQHVGHDGRAAVISFNGNKTITAGAGGVLLTNDTGFAERARHVSTQAKQPHPYLFEHDAVGYNYRMGGLNAALALAQLEALPELLARKRRLAEGYAALFEGLDGIRLLQEPKGCQSNHWLVALVLDEDRKHERLGILALLNAHKIEARALWAPLHTQPMYAQAPSMGQAVAEALYERIICLPSSPGLVS